MATAADSQLTLSIWPQDIFDRPKVESCLMRFFRAPVEEQMPETVGTASGEPYAVPPHLLTSAGGWIRMKPQSIRTHQVPSFRWGNRESGATPERSGHCERGASRSNAIVPPPRRGEKARQAQIREPGNLLGTGG